MDFDTVNRQLAGSPLWESVKAQVLSQFRSKLGVTPTADAPVAAPVDSSTPPVGPRILEAVNLRAQGLSYREVAKRMGLTLGTVNVMLYTARKRGVAAGTQPAVVVKPTRESEIVGLRESGKTYAQIADALGITSGTVAHMLHRARHRDPKVPRRRAGRPRANGPHPKSVRFTINTMTKAGKSPEDIAKAVGWTKSAVQSDISTQRGRGWL